MKELIQLLQIWKDQGDIKPDGLLKDNDIQMLIDKMVYESQKSAIPIVRLSFTSIDKAVNDLNLNKRVKWFVWNGELVRKGRYCPEPVIVNGIPVLINEA